MAVFWLVLALLAVAFLGIGIKVLFGGEFSGTCASGNPQLNPSGDPCSFCGRTPDKSHICIKKVLGIKR